MYYCRYCGEEFEEPVYKTHQEAHSELDPRDPWRFETFQDEPPLCPHCGSDDLDDGYACEICEERFARHYAAGLDLCDGCYEKAISIFNKAEDRLQNELGLDFESAKDFVIWRAQQLEG